MLSNGEEGLKSAEGMRNKIRKVEEGDTETEVMPVIVHSERPFCPC